MRSYTCRLRADQHVAVKPAENEGLMCGIVGVFGHHPVSGIIYDSLSMLQHRGQDAAGIATCYQDQR